MQMEVVNHPTLDVVVLINSLLYEKLTDENFLEAIDLCFAENLNSTEIWVNGMSAM
jgi:hypothetical protein